ncbi:hypothetical protein [Pedobacter endophyticus]|uniref:DUF1801 domain-containing protein n=1 Tax=Pedobacter endophyticus TaxID=2789740 RepID=A0A7S9L111_9SPHI|nr:hypothetical protein [Pedobacter endophyticus]QPH40309.1 hypothetical protein IZT61_03250 [Pedobacter endophyticus]
MKTDPVEIFQSIRASVQPYGVLGYTVHENSEKGYDLYSEKNVQTENGKTTERFFVGIYINDQAVDVKLNTEEFTTSNQELINFGDNRAGMTITQLDDAKLKEIATFVEIIHQNFKEKDWI